MNKIGIIGFGHFGRALAEVLEENDKDYLAYDIHAVVPEEHKTASVKQLLQEAELIILAVPVPQMRTVLEQIRPALHSKHIVLDVGSVKTTPLSAMEEILGDEIPYVGCHPLFGPTSLALGERPLNVVVCPNQAYPEITQVVCDFWKSLDCKVVRQEPREHDHDMAMTHALTFFVAKGMLDAGAGEDVKYAPPSFSAISRTIDTVRSDAGHLFAAIHRDNPFAAKARQKLIDALISVDKNVKDYQPQIRSAAEEAVLDIPASTDTPPELLQTRELIDQLDRELIELLGRRANLSRRAKKAKATVGRAVRDSKREEQLLRARKEWGENVGLDNTAVDEIFDTILRNSRRIQGGN
ncbi:MAG: prephenate dehydrogenase/arogenate dehydrogenase family protein [Myxococcota bacterium]|nr:prephenate dehydrogenase/arogenate dehydrogenase family protein [Myxococcota bacterium]